MLPLLKKALAKETDPEIKPMLEIIQAALELKSTDHATRLGAIRILGLSNNSNAKTLLLSVLEKTPDGKYIETDEEIYVEAQKSLRAVEGRLAWGDRIGVLFSGVSLGSILLLAALGLAITYGLMGVINMAHGELIMIGAYTTYVIQNLFKAHAPGLFDWYLLSRCRVLFSPPGSSASRSSAPSSAFCTAGRSKRCSRHGASASS